MQIQRFGILLSTALACLLVGCGDNGPCGCTDDTEGLAFNRDDGTAISFPPDARPFVWCGPWESSVAEAALHVFFGNLATGTPSWNLRVVLADAAVGDTLFIPNTFVWDQPDSLDFFLLDPPNEFDPPNELSSQQQESSGFLVFRQLGCDPGQAVEFDLDAVLASELAGQPAVSVQGRFVASITGAPSAVR